MSLVRAGFVLLGAVLPVVTLGVIGLYAGLHFLFGLITFTDVLAGLGLTPDYVLFTLGLPVAFSFFRLISFAVDAPKLAPGALPGIAVSTLPQSGGF